MSADITEERRYKQYKKVVEKHFWKTLKKKLIRGTRKHTMKNYRLLSWIQNRRALEICR
jgi:hypothetical protein